MMIESNIRNRVVYYEWTLLPCRTIPTRMPHKGSVVTDYQYDVNTRSDVDFLRETIDQAEVSEEIVVLIADTAYASELAGLAADQNIGILTTGLRGRKTREILTQFVYSEDGLSILRCPGSSFIYQSN